MYYGGRKRGATKSPTVQVGPPNGNNAASLRTTPRHGTQPTEPTTTEQAPTNTRPNLSGQREPQPRPQVEDNPTRTQPARQATRKTSPPPRKRTATHKTPTNRQAPPPNRGTTRTETHSPPSGWGAGLKEGSKGNRPPRTRHPEPETQPQPETGHRSRDPHHPPGPPPSTPHRVPCTHAMEHIQPTPTLANKLE